MSTTMTTPAQPEPKKADKIIYEAIEMGYHFGIDHGPQNKAAVENELDNMVDQFRQAILEAIGIAEGETDSDIMTGLYSIQSDVTTAMKSNLLKELGLDQ